MLQSRRQFSLRTALLITSAAAVFLALVKAELFAFRDVLLCASGTLIAIGLCQQARAIHAAAVLRADRKSRQLSWHLAEHWRYAVAVGIVICWSARIVLAIDFIHDWLSDPFGTSLLRTVHDSCLLLIVFGLSGTFAASILRRPKPTIRKWADGFGLVSGIILGGIALLTASLIDALIHNATRGIVVAQPYRLSGQLIEPVSAFNYQLETNRVRIAAYIAVLLAIVSTCVLYCIPNTTGNRRRFLWALWGFAAVPVSVFGVWMHIAGLRSISPFLADALVEGPILATFSALVIGTVFCAAASCHLCSSQRNCATEVVSLNWHGEQRLGVHEGRFAAIVTIVAVVTWALPNGLWEPYESPSMFADLFFFDGATGWLLIATLWLALRVMLLSPTTRRITAMEEFPVVSQNTFVQYFASTAVTLFAFVEAVKWSSFMLWIG